MDKKCAYFIILSTSYLGVFPIRGRSQTTFTRFGFFDHLPPFVYIFYGIKVYKKSIFLTTYPPPLVNVVCERPPILHTLFRLSISLTISLSLVCKKLTCMLVMVTGLLLRIITSI